MEGYIHCLTDLPDRRTDQMSLWREEPRNAASFVTSYGELRVLAIHMLFAAFCRDCGSSDVTGLFHGVPQLEFPGVTCFGEHCRCAYAPLNLTCAPRTGSI